MVVSRTVRAAGLALVVGLTSASYALFGIGGHYVLDFSVKMPDATGEQLVFSDLNLNTNSGLVGGLSVGFLDSTGNTPAAWQTLSFGPDDIPVFFDRSGFDRTPFGLGGKIYVDVIPFFDCLEIGGEIAAFEYTSRIMYPTNIDVPDVPTDPTSLMNMIQAQTVTVEYDTMDLTLEGNGITFPGISQTPYVKLNMNLTLRKYIPIKVIDRFLRPYAGAGFDIHFATPVPSAGLIEDAVGEALSGSLGLDSIQAILGSSQTQEDILNELLARLMTPHFGMNIVVGLMLKPPVIPIGIYADGKFMIPFGDFDEDSGVTGLGFKLNAGLVLHFGKKKT